MAARPLRCPRCLTSGYRQDGVYQPSGKPKFKCDGCGAEWSAGKTGGEFMLALQKHKRAKGSK